MTIRQPQRNRGFWGRLSIGRKLGVAFVTLLTLFLGAVATAFVFASALESGRERTQHTFEVLVAIGDVQNAMLAMENGLRGYVISGDEGFLEPYTKGKARFEKSLRRTTRLTSDNASQQERLARVEALEQRWQREIVATVRNQITSGNREAARQLIAERAGEVMLTPLRLAFEQLSLAELQLLAEREARFARIQERAILTMLALFTLGLLIGLAAIIGVSRQISRPMGGLAGNMRDIADGDLEVSVPHQDRGDEVGEIARALEHFREVSIISEATSWVRSNLETLRVSLQHCVNEQELAQTLLDELAPLIGARYAAFYARNETSNHLELLAGYGCSTESDLPQSFAMGDGLVGQCARSGDKLLIDDVPDDYYRVGSALGSGLPRRLIIVPAVYADETFAVIEFALFDGYRERYNNLFDELLPTTALSLATLRRHRQTQDLLAETRAQSGELRDQREQLRNTNKELREQREDLSRQSEELRASEEELKVQAEELQATNEELRQKGELLEARKSELEQAREELEQRAHALAEASRYKSEFLANMSHELRTPLNSLLILARSLADNDQGHLDADEVEAARIVHDSGQNLLRLINDILDLSKIEAGKMQAHMEQVSLAAFAERLRRTFAHVAVEKKLEYHIGVADDLPASVVTDAGKLEQIVNNLLGNAFKFTREGAVSVMLKRPDTDIALRRPELTPENSICIAVRDEGIGIPEDKLERIFQAFEQVDSSTSRVYGGTGLGLSISQRLAHLLGGEIHLGSVPGQGSTFTVVFPVQPADKAIEPAPVSMPVARAARPGAEAETTPSAVPFIEDDRERAQPGERTILVIEDDKTFARVLRDDARNKGFQCLVAGDGETGLVLARKYLPSGVLLDIGLPGIDGWAVLEQLKARPETGTIPVHILSAGDAEDNAELGAARGAIGYLPKPASREGLESVFGRIIESAGASRRLLVIDDDDTAVVAVKTLLQKENIDISYARSGQEALQAIQQNRPDCIVLDLNLPDISGFDLLERISNGADAPPVVVYSGRELSDDENMRLREHTDSIVIKGAHSSSRLRDEVTLFLHSIRGRNRPAAAPSAPAVADGDLAGKTVLLVDDDMRNTFALSRVLRGKGLKVLMAQDGYKALEHLQRQPDIDIVLMDIMMPELDGYETMRRIRAQSQFASLPILALTAKAMAGDREQCLAAGASDYLSKPIDTDKLLSMMRAWT